MIEYSATALGLAPRAVILSFDDGPVPEGQSMQLLDVLAEHGVQAAFCLVGARIPGNEKVVQRMYREGHLIVNHGYAHRMPDQMTAEEFEADITAFDDLVAEVLAEPTWKSRYYRPPGGHWSRRTEERLVRTGKQLLPLTYFAWDIFPHPFQQQAILGKLLRRLRRKGAGLFLLHEAVVPLLGEKTPVPARAGRRWVAQVVADLIVQAQQEGFEFVAPDAFSLPDPS